MHALFNEKLAVKKTRKLQDIQPKIFAAGEVAGELTEESIKLLDYSKVTVSHNPLRGAAIESIINAELLVAEGNL